MKHLSPPYQLAPLGALDRNRAWRVLVPIVVALLLVPAVVLLGRPQPATLASVHLVGPRGPACVRLVLANDVSGSMYAFAVPRDTALAQLQRWAPQNLRPDDQVGVLEFAGDAAWQIPPTPVGQPVGRSGPSARKDGTVLGPVLDLVHALPHDTCDTYLLLLSDGALSDLPGDEAAARAELVGHRVHAISLLVPGRRIDVPEAWSTVYPAAAPVRFDGNDADATGLAFAQVVADITGQSLKKA